MTANPDRNDIRGDLPAGWFGWGGHGGYRIMRFGEFNLGETDLGWHGNRFLANGTSGLSALYCQTPVIVREDERIILEQDEPVQVVLYDSVGQAATGTGNIVQAFNMRWAQPGEKVTFDAPRPNTGDYAGWTRRFRRAASANARENVQDVLEREGRECVKGMLVSHGDYRHVAAKRHVPSELFRPHPRTETHRAAHSLVWALPTGSDIAQGVTLGDDVAGRNLVDGVTYDKGGRPDFTFNPENRQAFAPLLSPRYKFPIDPSITRDFDNGFGLARDGAYINKADDGADRVPGSNIFNQKLPYYQAAEWGNESYEDRVTETFSPNRIVSSPVAFGSIPSASQANAPWTCLLFRPNLSKEPPPGRVGEWSGVQWRSHHLGGFCGASNGFVRG